MGVGVGGGLLGCWAVCVCGGREVWGWRLGACVCVCAEPQATASVLKQDPKVMAQKHCLDTCDI